MTGTYRLAAGQYATVVGFDETTRQAHVVGFWPTTYQHEHVHSMFEISQKCFF
jgi:hypothetical protein